MPDTLPTRIEAERVYLRRYEATDVDWYFAMSQRNRNHLAVFEPDDILMSIHSLQDAERVLQRLAADWEARKYFVFGAFDRKSGEFVAQIDVGRDPGNREFGLGYLADCDHQGKGYVTEAVRAVLGFIFEHLQAHRVRVGIDDRNERSLRVARRCGMVEEGHFRETQLHADGT